MLLCSVMVNQVECSFFADIDECKAEVYPCKDQQHCTNLPGSYKCYSKSLTLTHTHILSLSQ